MILPPPPLRDHLARHRLQGEQQALDVDREDLGIALAGDLEQGRHLEEGGVVDQDVDAAGAVHHRLDHGVDRGLPGHVDLDREGALADLARGLLGVGEQDVGDRDARALTDVALGDRATDPARAPGDHGDLVVQSHRSPPRLRTDGWLCPAELT